MRPRSCLAALVALVAIECSRQPAKPRSQQSTRVASRGGGPAPRAPSRPAAVDPPKNSKHGESVARWVRTSHTCNSTDPRPNILFLQADDFARATISAYQSHLAPIVKTPHIDKLAAEGAIFDRSFVTNSLCGP